MLRNHFYEWSNDSNIDQEEELLIDGIVCMYVFVCSKDS
jgi:hypothetical protein